LSIDDGALNIQLLAGESSAALAISGQATSTGNLLTLSNSGTGNDIYGTSGTWYVSKAGAAVFAASVTTAAIVGSANLAIDATGTGTIGIGETSTGTVTITPALVAVASVTITGTADSNCLVVTAGDISVANGKIAITNDDTDAIFTATAAAVTTGNVILVTANGVTSGTMLNLVTTSAGFSGGYFIACNDGSVRFSVGVDGATTITSGVNSTKALEVTGIQTSENLVTLTSSGVTASDKAIILINSSGNSAAGSNQIRIAPSGTPVEASVGIEFVGASKLMQAMVLDGDSVDNSVAVINGGGALAANKAVLELTADGTPAANTSSILRVDSTGLTDTNNPYAIRVLANGVDAGGLYIDSDSATLSAVAINGGGAIATGKAVVAISADGTPAATDSSVLSVAFTGTATNNPKLVTLTGTGKDVGGIYLDTDNTDTHGVAISGSGALDGGNALYVTNDGTPAAATDAVANITFGGTATNNPIVLKVDNGTADALPLLVVSNVAAATRQVASFIQDSTTGAIEVLHLKQDDTDVGILKIEATAGSGNTVDTDDKSSGSAVYIKININGTAYWIKATPAA
jgi:hypothetical protein